MSIWKNGKLVAGGSQALPLLTFMWADHILDNMSWLRADTFSWQSGAVYETAYQHLVDDIDGFSSSIDILIPAQGESLTFVRYEDGDITGYYAWKNNDSIAYTDTLSLSVGDDAYLSLSPVKTGEITSVNNSLQSETIGGVTVQFYLADDGHKICPASEESNVVAIYNATGIAWYYIIDTTNERFKLPRTQYGVTGLRDNVGDYVSESLPDIKFAFNQDGNHNNGSGLIWGVSGALTATSGSGRARYNPAGTGTVNTGHIEFSASNSSSAYQDSAPVQQRATQMYLYFYVGQFTQTALENTAGVVTEDFNELNAHKVIEFQAPTAQNNYTWYRKYADGWVEQGGSKASGGSGNHIIDLPVTMSDTAFWVQVTRSSGASTTTNVNVWVRTPTSTSQITVYTSDDTGIKWEVRGMAA